MSVSLVQSGRIYSGPDGREVLVKRVAWDTVGGTCRQTGEWIQIDLEEFRREWTRKPLR